MGYAHNAPAAVFSCSRGAVRGGHICQRDRKTLTGLTALIQLIQPIRLSQLMELVFLRRIMKFSPIHSVSLGQILTAAPVPMSLPLK